MTRYEALEKLLELSEKATPGPWDAGVRGRKSVDVQAGDLFVADFYHGRDADREANTQFVAAARNAIPELRALLADVREREPVAYRYDISLGSGTGGRSFQDSRSQWHLDKGWTETPLYTSPPSQQAVDVGGLAKEIWSRLGREVADCEPPAWIEEQIRKHLVSPREGWQPIETAPKDGTSIMVWVPTWLQGKGAPCFAIWFNNCWMPTDKHMRRIEPSLWMPEPSPPLAPTVREK